MIDTQELDAWISGDDPFGDDGAAMDRVTELLNELKKLQRVLEAAEEVRVDWMNLDDVYGRVSQATRRADLDDSVRKLDAAINDYDEEPSCTAIEEARKL